MSWVRIHDAALSHPKIVGLFHANDPFHLWVWGLSYCQMHLTDGLIPIDALPPRTTRSVEQLIARRLWELHPSGYLIHDYLDWNNSREFVAKSRTEAKTRQHRHRSKAADAPMKRVSPSEGVTRDKRQTPSIGLDVLGLDRTSEKEVTEKSTAEPDVGQVAARFCERFAQLYTQHRNGAHYHLKPSLDWSRVCQLLTTWNVARLEKLAVILLTTDDVWISSTDRGIGVFLAKASWCDDRLKAWETEHGVTA